LLAVREYFVSKRNKYLSDSQSLKDTITQVFRDKHCKYR